MAAKKSKKSVIEYDPLAWLDEEDHKKDELVEPVAAMSETVPSSADEKILSDDEGYGFFDDAETDGVESHLSEKDGEEPTEGYGFFDDVSSGGLTTQGVSRDETSNVIDLGAELTIQSVSTCKSLVEDMMNQGFDVQIDAQNLQKIDTAGLQLLLSVKSTLEKTSQQIIWKGRSSVINQSAALLGLPAFSEDDEDGNAYGFFSETANASEVNTEVEESGFGFF